MCSLFTPSFALVRFAFFKFFFSCADSLSWTANQSDLSHWRALLTMWHAESGKKNCQRCSTRASSAEHNEKTMQTSAQKRPDIGWPSVWCVQSYRGHIYNIYSNSNRLIGILQLYISHYDTFPSLYAQVEEVVTVKVLWSPHKWLFLKMWVNHSWWDTIYTWNTYLTPPAVILSWPDRSSVKGVRGSSRFVMSPEHQSKSTSPYRVLRTASSPSQEPKTRSRTLSTCYRTGMLQIEWSPHSGLKHYDADWSSLPLSLFTSALHLLGRQN